MFSSSNCFGPKVIFESGFSSLDKFLHFIKFATEEFSYSKCESDFSKIKNTYDLEKKVVTILQKRQFFRLSGVCYLLLRCYTMNHESRKTYCDDDIYSSRFNCSV